MTYKEYSQLTGRRDHLISRKRSLLMTVRMNDVWSCGRLGKRADDRRKKLNQAKEELATITIPPMPDQPVGYAVYIGDEWNGFYATDDKEYVREQVTEFLGHNNFRLVAEPRYRDD